MSLPIHPSRGLLQRSTLAKLALEEPLQQVVRAQGVTNVDVWLDDVSIDTVHNSAAIGAGAALQTYRELYGHLQAEGLVISQKKTHFVDSSAKVVAELNKARAEADPETRSLARDLGIDSAGARRRRLLTCN